MVPLSSLSATLTVPSVPGAGSKVVVPAAPPVLLRKPASGALAPSTTAT